MPVKQINHYQFACDEMRYTRPGGNLLELCDGTAVFPGVDELDAADAAKAAGWHCDTGGHSGIGAVVCPFHEHSLPDGRPWPPRSEQR